MVHVYALHVRIFLLKFFISLDIFAISPLKSSEMPSSQESPNNSISAFFRSLFLFFLMMANFPNSVWKLSGLLTIAQNYAVFFSAQRLFSADLPENSCANHKIWWITGVITHKHRDFTTTVVLRNMIDHQNSFFMTFHHDIARLNRKRTKVCRTKIKPTTPSECKVYGRMRESSEFPTGFQPLFF